MVDFIDQIRALGAVIPKQIEDVTTEAQTKTSFVQPFIGALGYDITDPKEVVAEFTADIGIKKGEKVDYAIKKDGKPIILFECKHHAADLKKEHGSQLHRYFHTTTARIGILTNGKVYQFFTDLEEPNKMDSKPFLELNMLDIKDSDVEEIKKFSKDEFVLDEITKAAEELKYTRAIQRFLAVQFTNPSEDFVRFLAEQIYKSDDKSNSKRIGKAVVQQFTNYTSRACQQYIEDRIIELVKKPALADSEPKPEETQVVAASAGNGDESSKDGKIVTTEEEIEGYHIVKAIIRDIVDPSRVVMRDTVSYCGILLDDNNRKPICRLHFNDKIKFVSIMGAENKNYMDQERIVINQLYDLFQHTEKLRKAAASFDA